MRKVALVFKLALQDLRGNLAVHVVACAIISAAFLTVGLFLLMAANLQALADFWERKVEVSVYLDDSVNDAQSREMLSRLYSLAGVEEVEYIDKDRALSEFRSMLGQDADLLEGLEDNPLPASFSIRLAYDSRRVDEVKKFAGEIEGWEGVANVDYGGSWLEAFSSAVRVAQGAVLVLGGLIVVAVVFIIGNTIRLTMYSRRDEIEIMRLVGASNLIVRLPFVIEGVGQGISASILGALGAWALYLLALHGASWPGMLAGFTPVFIPFRAVLLLVLGGALLGALGSINKLKMVRV